MGNVVTKSELANVMLDFGNPSVRRGWLILNGQPVESDLAYQQIYATAKKTIFVVDNYIGLKTLERWRKSINVIRYNSTIYISLFSLKS